MQNRPTAEEIYEQVRRKRPRGWRWFTMDTARRVETALATSGSEYRTVGLGVIRTGGRPPVLAEHAVHALADKVRTNNGAVGFSGSLILSWLAWKLVETAVWWAIQWAWRKEWGLDG